MYLDEIIKTYNLYKSFVELNREVDKINQSRNLVRIEYKRKG